MKNFRYHSEFLAMMETIMDHNHDPVPRLVLVDWLEEHGEVDYAQYIRLDDHGASIQSEPTCQPVTFYDRYLGFQEDQFVDGRSGCSRVSRSLDANFQPLPLSSFGEHGILCQNAVRNFDLRNALRKEIVNGGQPCAWCDRVKQLIPNHCQYRRGTGGEARVPKSFHSVIELAGAFESFRYGSWFYENQIRIGEKDAYLNGERDVFSSSHLRFQDGVEGSLDNGWNWFGDPTDNEQHLIIQNTWYGFPDVIVVPFMSFHRHIRYKLIYLRIPIRYCILIHEFTIQDINNRYVTIPFLLAIRIDSMGDGLFRFSFEDAFIYHKSGLYRCPIGWSSYRDVDLEFSA